MPGSGVKARNIASPTKRRKDRTNFRRPRLAREGLVFYFSRSLTASFQRFALECMPRRFASTFHLCMAETKNNPLASLVVHIPNKYEHLVRFLPCQSPIRPRPPCSETCCCKERARADWAHLKSPMYFRLQEASPYPTVLLPDFLSLHLKRKCGIFSKSTCLISDKACKFEF